MSDEWLTIQQEAECLNYLLDTILVMLREERLQGEKVNSWLRVKTDEYDVDPGMVEVTIALAGVATAIAAFLPGISGISEIPRLIAATVSSAVALLSAYGALWLLARYCLLHYCLTGESLFLGAKESLSGRKEVWKLLKNLDKIGPYKFIVVGLLFLLVLSVFVGVFAFMR